MIEVKRLCTKEFDLFREIESVDLDLEILWHFIRHTAIIGCANFLCIVYPVAHDGIKTAIRLTENSFFTFESLEFSLNSC